MPHIFPAQKFLYLRSCSACSHKQHFFLLFPLLLLFSSPSPMDVNGLAMNSDLPPGFRFHPTDQELIQCYLTNKVTASLPSNWNIIADIDLYKFNPWDLPDKAFFGEKEWFFFSPRERKYPNGVRPNRKAGIGYWKATGTDKPILGAGGSHCIGVKKALVFHKGRPPKGLKTEWIMDEYRLLESTVAPQTRKQKGGSMRLDEWVLCRVRQKGKLPAASDEVVETSSPAESSFTVNKQSEEKQGVVINGTSFTDWNESQLINSLFESQKERDSLGEVLDPAFFMRFGEGDSGDYTVAQQQVGSLKRKQYSFGALDESMLLLPEKKLQCLVDRLFSPAESISNFPDFFLC